MRVKIVIKSILLCILLFLQCGYSYIFGSLDETEKPFTGLPRALKAEEVKLTSANNNFGLKLFREIVNQDRDKNIFISPLSVSLALGMIYNGAAGETEKAIRNVLEYGDLTVQEINESYKFLLETLVNLDPDINLSIANSIWHHSAFLVNQNFKDVNELFFDADVSNLDFFSPNASTIINNWVNDKTNGLIPEIIKKIEPDIVMYLINALYFKGNWTKQFDINKTHIEVFHQENGLDKEVSMMSQKSNINYYRGDIYTAAEISYGSEVFFFTILLPNFGKRVDEIIALLDTEKIQEITKEMNKTTLLFMMPKFKLEFELQLKQVLSIMGMSIAFEAGNADFSKINNDKMLFINKVKHKTFVEVNEEGTEAAAVTSIGLIPTGSPPEFIVNRPFVFLIRERLSNTILFIGKIVDPVYE